MVYSLLSGYGPSVEPVYDDRSNAIWIMVVIICALLLLTIIFLYLWLENRSSKKEDEKRNENSLNDVSHLTESELQVISGYRKLDNAGKELVNNTIQTLNSKINND